MIFKRINDDLLFVIDCNDQRVVDLGRWGDDVFVCFPQIFQGTALTSADLRKIADKLDELNKP